MLMQLSLKLLRHRRADTVFADSVLADAVLADIAAMFAPALLAGVFFCAGFALSENATARDLNQDEALQLRKSGKLMPLDSLLQIVRQRYPDARLLEAELESEDDRLIYELEVLTTGGGVREVELDASNGAVLKDEEED